MQFRELRIDASRSVCDHAEVVQVPGLIFHHTTHHVRQIFASFVPKGYSLDGSSLISVTCGPRGRDPQYRQSFGGTSQYFVEDFDFVDYGKRSPTERERIVLATSEAALSDIARRHGMNDDVIRQTAAAVVECGFQRTIEIPKLRKSLRPSGNAVRVFRRLAVECGESWHARIVRRDGSIVVESEMEKATCLDRRDNFKSADIVGQWYVIKDRLGNETFRLDVSSAI